MDTVTTVLASVSCSASSYTRPDAMPAEAEAGWWHFFGLMHRDRLEEEVAAASRAFVEQSSAVAERRLVALLGARDALRRGEQGGDAEP